MSLFSQRLCFSSRTGIHTPDGSEDGTMHFFNSTACACSVRRREEGEGEKKGSKRNREDRRKGNEGR